MELPTHLRDVLEQIVLETNPRRLAGAVRDLNTRYQKGQATSVAGPVSWEHAVAYAATRLPGTFGAVSAVLSAAHSQMPEFSPRTVLDVGSGPGTALWAAWTEWPSIGAAHALEREQAMQQIGEWLLNSAGTEVANRVQWCQADIEHAALSRYDLVAAAYVIGEIPSVHRRDVWRKLWDACEDMLVVVEPGTPLGFDTIRSLRHDLGTRGGHIVAPCPHDDRCPIAEPDWCHFSERVPRSRRQKQLKGGAAPYEDEKYSYVVMSRRVIAHGDARVIRHPRREPGRIGLELCTVDGLSTVGITKREPAVFRQARKVKWGDVWPSPANTDANPR